MTALRERGSLFYAIFQKDVSGAQGSAVSVSGVFNTGMQGAA